ncbi:glycosyltransferase [Lutibacter sp.]|uniref:glycosyltransferase n=1 Tax=Lutibacter sp. TaxID=1925666 RepID=UPI0025C29C2D|nr:glycosyltransferase [Lutibacter sp.]MCF6182663.1 glycosyltransferase [Lutibacter sp.]
MKNKLKVIQIIDSLNPGGAEMMAVNIANGLAKNGIKSFLCATRIEGDLKTKINDEVGYLFLNKKSSLGINTFIKLSKFIKRNQIAIIHAHSSSYFIASIIKVMNPSVKLVWHNHYGNSENLPILNKILLIGISNIFNSTISVNLKLKEWAISTLKSKNNYYLPNFASLNAKIKETTFLKKNNNTRILCLANFRPEKDHINLLKAFIKVQKTHSDWTLHLIGLDLMNNYSDSIKSFIIKHQLTNTVFLYGACQDIAFILEQATIGILASKSEGLPVALLEYGLAKLSVVVTNVGDCANVVTNEINGLIVPPNNDVLLGEAILKLINKPKLSKTLGEELFNTVTSKFSKEKYISKLIKIYH